MELTVRDYRDAVRDIARQLEGPASTVDIEMQLIANKLDTTFRRVHSRMSMAEYLPHRVELTAAMLPTRVRVEGAAPWRLYRCECCIEHLLICTCPPLICECEGPLLTEFGKMMVSQLDLVSTPAGEIDPYLLVNVLTGKDCALMAYGDYLTVSEAIVRSYTYPFWLELHAAKEGEPTQA